MTLNSQPPSRYWHPFLIALYPVASLYTANRSAVELSHLVLPIIAVLVLTAVAVVLFTKLLPNREKATLASSWSMAALFGYDLVFRGTNAMYRVMAHTSVPVSQEYSFVLWGILWIIGLVFIWRSCFTFVATNKFLNSMSAILLAVTCLIAAQGAFLGTSSQSDSAASLVQKEIPLLKPEQPLNIYFLVFDRYAGAETLSQVYGYDNQPFLAALRDRGFTVSDKSLANYPRTIYSMASALNLTFLPEVPKSDKVYAEMIQEQVAALSLKAIGYKYLHYGNWYQPLRKNKHADYVLPTSIFPSEFAEFLYKTTPISKLLPLNDKFDFTIKKFQEVAATSEQDEPVFVYAHFLMPHNPYVFDADRSRLDWKVSRYGNSKDNYVRQLQATNAFILETVDKILKNSAITPLIVLIADEGPYLTRSDRELAPKTKKLVRCRILSAFKMPPAGEAVADESISPSISPVNVFRMIFTRYFGANLPLLPDRAYYWEEADDQGRPAKDNKRFVDVTDELSQ